MNDAELDKLFKESDLFFVEVVIIRAFKQFFESAPRTALFVFFTSFPQLFIEGIQLCLFSRSL